VKMMTQPVLLEPKEHRAFNWILLDLKHRIQKLEQLDYEYEREEKIDGLQKRYDVLASYLDKVI